MLSLVSELLASARAHPLPGHQHPPSSTPTPCPGTRKEETRIKGGVQGHKKNSNAWVGEKKNSLQKKYIRDFGDGQQTAQGPRRGHSRSDTQRSGEGTVENQWDAAPRDTSLPRDLQADLCCYGGSSALQRFFSPAAFSALQRLPSPVEVPQHHGCFSALQRFLSWLGLVVGWAVGL